MLITIITSININITHYSYYMIPKIKTQSLSDNIQCFQEFVIFIDQMQYRCFMCILLECYNLSFYM